MNDPYKILNVPSTASDEEVKKAYRELARKYHPDNYHDSPLEDLAQEKMKEINEAYDTIMKMRGSGHGAGRSTAGSYGGYRPSGSYGGYGGAGTQADPRFRDVRAAISRGDLYAADHLLSILSEHSGEWYFLKGVICQRRGWLDEARRNYETACHLSPGNPEYFQALERLSNSAQGYRPEGYEVFTTGCADNMCGRLACAYCLCNALGFGGMRFYYCC